jgi:hypothetical protein
MKQRQLNKLINAHPDLSNSGFRANWKHFGYYRSQEEYEIDFASHRQYLREHLDEVNLSLEWLSQCPRKKTINTSYSSYSYKHHVEKAGSPWYVTNGDLIAAVLHLGIPYRKNAPNIYVAINLPPRPLVPELKVSCR